MEKKTARKQSELQKKASGCLEANASLPAIDWPRIRAVCIDIDETLLDFKACARLSMIQAFEELGMEFQESWFEAYRHINDGLWEQMEKQELTMDEFRKIRFPLIFAAVGLDHLDGEDFEHRFRKYLYDSHTPVDHAAQALEVLGQHWPLYIVSNGDQAQQENRLAKAGMLPHFAKVFTSESMKAKKPDQQFFKAAFQGMEQDLPDLRPQEVLIIGDSVRTDVAGGLQAGWQIFHFQNNWPQLIELVTDLQDEKVQG